MGACQRVCLLFLLLRDSNDDSRVDGSLLRGSVATGGSRSGHAGEVDLGDLLAERVEELDEVRSGEEDGRRRRLRVNSEERGVGDEGGVKDRVDTREDIRGEDEGRDLKKVGRAKRASASLSP